jgi:hypothetical protein
MDRSLDCFSVFFSIKFEGPTLCRGVGSEGFRVFFRVDVHLRFLSSCNLLNAVFFLNYEIHAFFLSFELSVN